MPASGTVAVTTDTATAPRYVYVLGRPVLDDITLVNITPVSETLDPADITAALQLAYETGYAEGFTDGGA